MGLSDGRRVLALATSKDYKRIGDDDTGPNTGGMGAHSPAFVIAESESERFARAGPRADGARHGRPKGTRWSACVYAGLMLTAAGPRVLEFNLRFGDPEAPGAADADGGRPGELLDRGAAGGFETDRLRFAPRWPPASCWPTGAIPISRRPATRSTASTAPRSGPACDVFHAGTALRDGR